MPRILKNMPTTPAGDLLRQSRAANLERIRAGNGKPPNYAVAEQHAARALALRLQAHETDADHQDAEWANDTVPHADMVAFLRTYPSIP